VTGVECWVPKRFFKRLRNRHGKGISLPPRIMLTPGLFDPGAGLPIGVTHLS
jgi:hypothetical protein